MKFFRKHPFESIVLFLLAFSFLFSTEWVGVHKWHKISAVIVFCVFIGLVMLLHFAFSGLSLKVKKYIYYFLAVEENRGRYNIPYIIKLSTLGFVITVIVAFFEFFIEMVLYNNFPPISVGIPFTIYSFSAMIIVARGILLDTVFYGLLTKLIFETTLKE